MIINNLKGWEYCPVESSQEFWWKGWCMQCDKIWPTDGESCRILYRIISLLNHWMKKSNLQDDPSWLNNASQWAPNIVAKHFCNPEDEPWNLNFRMWTAYLVNIIQSKAKIKWSQILCNSDVAHCTFMIPPFTICWTFC